MPHYHQFYIDGQWVEPGQQRRIEVVNPATEEVFATIAAGDASDVDRAVKVARRAFESYAWMSCENRVELLQTIVDIYKKRTNDLAEAISIEMGAPLSLVAPAREMSMMVGAMFGMLILRERVTTWRVIGCLILIGGVVLLGSAKA